MSTLNLATAYRYQRRYTGPLQAVVFDWAGTTLDYGCMAPAIVFQAVFADAGVPISMQEARGPMGTEKREHIRLVLADDGVCARWQAKQGALPTSEDVDRLYAAFIPAQLESLRQHAQLIPGAAEVIAQLRTQGCAIGATTGYSKDMMAIIQEEAAKQGYVPDFTISADQVAKGRPYPHMLMHNAINLGVSNMEAVVKVDDTTPGIEAGLNAGCWTIGLAVSGNDVGLSLDEWNALPEGDKAVLRQQAYAKHIQAGAHYVVDSIADIAPCIEDIQRKLRMGEHPAGVR